MQGLAEPLTMTVSAKYKDFIISDIENKKLKKEKILINNMYLFCDKIVLYYFIKGGKNGKI